MATVVLQYAGAALGTMLGGPIGGMIGRAIGGLAGSIVDNAVFGDHSKKVGPRLNSLQVMASQEGSSIPIVYGRFRISGQVIWATNLLEEANSSGGGKGGMMGGDTQTDYSYFANFAVGLCEGEIQGLGRCWADGKEIDLRSMPHRLYVGSSTQMPDGLISAIEGTDSTPGFRGLAYIVFERLALAKFGNRLPQLSFEVLAKGNEVADLIKAVNIIPAATEFGYDTQVVNRRVGPGATVSENAHVSGGKSDWTVSVDQLQQSCANVGMASLVVSWFGTDLRCGSCLIKPGVDDASKVTEGATWGVSGMTRSLAHLVSYNNGAAAYGGTPSDASVLRAIADLKSRGLNVMFYPFILMDVPVGNNLPDPYGGVNQGAYPWRGRITGAVAPGLAGTVDKTGAAATQIAQFVGTATAAQFTASGESVTFAGSEWSYRRMILHYAKLCALAGGVDAFLIGSELRGLTQLRSAAGLYPFVAALQNLAAEVKAILPSAKISYAADWSEYFGHQPVDGTGDVYFHLDPLWASSSIDFVGVDNYFPLIDWREGKTHLDALAGARSIYDQSYLQSRFAGGEGYEWYYASQAARDGQLRSAIIDGAYGKPWVFRPKDLKSWWSEAHFNRPGGVQTVMPTAWVPQSKPIWFTEIGCAAVDKAANQPNLFIDAKSSESGLPAYSNGQADTQIALSFATAVHAYWGNAGASNPVSSVYGAPMVDAARMFFWCWDARPYPAFPARLNVWGDAANYARGHWLNGRVNGVDIASLIKLVAGRFGVTNVDVSNVQGLADGFVIDHPMSARDALEELLNAYAIDVFESEGSLKFVSRKWSRAQVIATGDFVEDDRDAPLFARHRAQETDLPVSLRFGYAESGLDYRQAAVSQSQQATSSKTEISMQVPIAMNKAAAQCKVDVLLAESWTSRESAAFTLPPRFEWVEPGDVLEIAGNSWRVKNIQAGVARKIEAVAHEAAAYDVVEMADRAVVSELPAVFSQPQVLGLDLALLGSGHVAGLRFATQASPWPGSMALYRQSGASSMQFSQILTQRAVMGQTLTTLNSGSIDRVDYGQTLEVKVSFGTLATVSREQLLGGANAAAIGSQNSGYEIIQFENAELIGPMTYRLSGLLRAQAGSLPEMIAMRAVGQDFVLLDNAVVQVGMAQGQIGLPAQWRIGPAQFDYGHPSYAEVQTYGAMKALRPLSPTYLNMRKNSGGYLMSWIRRSRIDGDGWEMAEIPIGEDVESYQLEILSGGIVKRQVNLTGSSYLYSTVDILADFSGVLPPSFTCRVAQVSGPFGPGALIERTFNA